MSLKQKLYYLVGGLFYHKYVHRLLPVRCYLKVRWHQTMGGVLDLDNPKTFNEKLQWLKINDRNPLYPTLVDKYEVKKWVAEKIGSEYVIPTLGLYDSVEQINFDELPDKFVLKCTHDSGSTVVCKDKRTFDFRAAHKLLSARLTYNYYWNAREWPYKNVKKRVIAEQYLEDGSGDDLTDYKFFCFNGEPTFCQVIRNRRIEETIDFYNMDWVQQEFVGLNPAARNGLTPVVRPVNFDIMKAICRKLASNIPFARIDLYEINTKVYFGEITFYPASGFGKFTPSEYDLFLGSMITMPKEKYQSK